MEKGQVRDIFVPQVGSRIKCIVVRKPSRRGGKYGFVTYAPNAALPGIFFVAV